MNDQTQKEEREKMGQRVTEGSEKERMAKHGEAISGLRMDSTTREGGAPDRW